MTDDDTRATLIRQYRYSDGTEAPEEDYADEVRVFTEPGDHVVTLYRHEGRLVDVDPTDVKGDTILWRDLDVWLDENL